MKAPVTSEHRLDGADRHVLHTDDELIRRWLRAQLPVRRPGRGTFLWARVSEQFCIGSTSAKDICLRHGFEPDTLVRKS